MTLTLVSSRSASETDSNVRVLRPAPDRRPPSDRRPRSHRWAPRIRGFRPDIEAARALAVLLVVLYHAGVPYLPGGYVGVDVFFVLSGFLITTHLLRELLDTGKVKFARFYARRARRLMPMAGLVLVLTVAATWLLVSGLKAADVGIDAVWAAFFAVNIHFALDGVDYQANQDPSPLQHFWSLSVEEQFYLAWPLLLVGAVVLVGRRASEQRRRAAVTAVVAVVAVASFWFTQDLMTRASTMAYFLSPTRAWELAIGGLVAALAPTLAKSRLLQNGVAGGIGLAMIIYSGIVYTEATPFPGVAALLPTVGTGLVIAAGLINASWLERFLLDRKLIQSIGRLSYGWYLWHWPMLILWSMVIDRGLTVTEGLVAISLGLWLAMCSYLVLEDPIRGSAVIASKPRRGLLVGICALVVTGVAAGAAIAIGPSSIEAGATVPTIADDQVVAAVQAAAAKNEVPANLDPSLEDVAKDKPNLHSADGISCMVGLSTSTVSEKPGGSCVAGGTERGKKTVVLVGDSHAYHWMPALREVAKKRHWRLVSLTKSGCTLFDVPLINTQLQRDYTECYSWRTAVMARIGQEKPDLIVTSAAIFSEREGDFSQRWTEGVTKTITALKTFGVPVYEIEDTPYPKKDIPTCAAQNPTDLSKCTLSPDKAYSDNARREATATAAKAAGAVLIDPKSWFCAPTVCPVVVANVMMYSDNSHMTQRYSALLGPVLGKFLPPTI